MLFLNLSLPVTQWWWYHNSPSTQDRNLGVILFSPFLLTSLSSPSASVSMLPCKYVSNLKGSLPHRSQVANPNFQHLLHLIGVSVSPCAFCIASFLFFFFLHSQFPKGSKEELFKPRSDFQWLENKASFGLPILNHVTHIFHSKPCSYHSPSHLTHSSPSLHSEFSFGHVCSIHQGPPGYLRFPHPTSHKSPILQVHVYNPKVSNPDLQYSDSLIPYPSQMWLPLHKTLVPPPLCPLC